MLTATLLFYPPAAHAQAWHTRLTVCDQNGTPVSGSGERGYYDGSMVGGTLTGSGSGSQSPSTGFSPYYDPSPGSWLWQSGIYHYSWMDDAPPRVDAQAGAELFDPDGDSPVRLTSDA